MNKQILWMAVTPDKYELPIAVAQTQTELARLLGIHRRKVAHMYHLQVHRGTRHRKFNIVKVEYEKETVY